MAIFARKDRPPVSQPVRHRAPVCQCPPEHRHNRPGPCPWVEDISSIPGVLVWSCPCRGVDA